MLNLKNIGSFLQRMCGGYVLGQTRVVYAFAKQIETKTTKKIVLSKKKNKQLAELKKSLSQKQPIKSQDLYKDYHFRDIYKRINIQMQSFFYERTYTIDNFNFLIHLISEQMPYDYKERMEQVLQKMALMKVQPDQKTYNYMIKAAANKPDVQLAQKYFKQAETRFLANKFFYTSLMQAYVNSQDTRMAVKILDEMIQKGLEPDLPTYTTLINCLRRGRELQKCWQLHKQMVARKIQQDETYTGVMLKVFAATHDAEKAIKLYKENITDKGIKPMIETINSYFKALATRREYSNHVVDRFIQLVQQGNVVTTETANWALKACSTIANVRSAGQILKIMKIKQIKIQPSTLSILLKVYSTACLIPNQNQKLLDIILTDSWKLLQQIHKMDGITTMVLNNMLSIYANTINYQQIDGLILPLYQKYKQPYNMYTYQILIDLYYRLDDFTTMMRVWKQMKKGIEENMMGYVERYGDLAVEEVKVKKMSEDIRPTFHALHCYLDMGIKMMDMNQVTQALKMFKKYNRTPKNATLKFLGNLQNLPQQIQIALMQFKIQFGKAKISNKQLPNIKDPQDL